MATVAQQSLYNQYIAAGVPAQNAAALVGVLSTESGANLATGSQGNAGTDASGVLSNGGGAFGIASWNGPRQTALQNYASSVGGSPSDLNTQGAFVLHEMQNSYPDTYAVLMNPNSTVKQVATSVVQNYERPASQYVEGNIASATDYAINIVQNSGAGGAAAAAGEWNWYDALLGTAKTAIAGADKVVDEQNAAGFGGGLIDTIFGYLTNFFVRGGIAVLGLVLIAGALYLYGRDMGKDIGKVLK